MAKLRQLEFPAGSILFCEGDHGDRLYIILDGQLEIIKSLGTPDEQLLNICVPGDYVGEMCLIDPEQSRSASVRTSSSVKLLEVTRTDLDALIHQYSDMGYAMAKVLSQRLRASEARMTAELKRKDRQLSEAHSHLESLLNKLTGKAGMEKRKKQGHHKSLAASDHDDTAKHNYLKGPMTLAKSWEIRRTIYRSSLCQINVETFGRFGIYRGLTVIEETGWDGHLPKLLLKSIVAHGSLHIPADELIEALWPEVDSRSGKRNLKITLHRLRKALEPEMSKAFGSSYIHLKDGLITLDQELCKNDLNDFLSFYRRGEESEKKGNIDAALLLYDSAIDLYKGDFLAEDLYIPWIDKRREELRKIYISLLNRIADIQERRGTSRTAIDCYKKIIQIDPLSEQAYQKLMTLYSNKHMHTEALRIYKDCQKALREGLDTEPEALTTSLYNKIIEAV
jgi:DNA-binding SARP family transcriptional activator/CRP-like cAMP-binding protein